MWECLGFSGIRGYNTGGCVHFIINNQVGFTTSPQFARSSPYPSDVAKGVQAPIFHVNGDDPEAVTFAAKMAIEFRQKFHRDIVIDMWCYRRFGHNEGDEPGFTQPLMYNRSVRTPASAKIYGKRLIQEGVIDQAWIDEKATQFTTLLEGEFEAGASYKPNKADWFAGRWSGLSAPPTATLRGATSKRASREAVRRAGPYADDGAGGHPDPQDAGPRARRQAADVQDRREFRLGDRRGLAFGSLLSEGYGVRLSGQDSGAARSASATRCGSTRPTSTSMCRLTTVRAWPVRGAGQPALRIWRARVRIWLRAGRPQDACHVGGAVRRLRQRRADHDRPVHRER